MLKKNNANMIEGLPSQSILINYFGQISFQLNLYQQQFSMSIRLIFLANLSIPRTTSDIHFPNISFLITLKLDFNN